MKTYVIQLEQHDDLISVRDKMSWAKSPRILLIWPPHKQANIRPLDMVLLKRHAASLGAKLGIASSFGKIRRSALDTGIPAFKTSVEAQSDIWTSLTPTLPGSKTKRRKIKRSDLRKERKYLSPVDPVWLKKSSARIWIFSAGVLAVLVFFVILLPSATIRISPISQPQKLTIPIAIDPEATAVNISGIVPAYALSTIVEGSGEISATGNISVPEARASGVVEFSNLTQSSVQIPEGTIVRTVSEPPVRFFITESGVVLAGVGETIELPVRAVEGGFAGNISPGSLQSIEGSLGLSLSVTNREPLTGGVDANKTTANDDDRERLLGQVEESLFGQAMNEIEKLMPSGGYLIANSLYTEPVSMVYNPPQGTPGATLSLNLKQKYRAYFIKSEDLASLGRLVLDSSTLEGYYPQDNTLMAVPVGSPAVDDNGEMTWELKAERVLLEELDPMEIISRVMGKTPIRAIENLSSIDMADQPEITLSPSWWLFMPSIPLRISVEMAQ
jgi:hypothetical protein